MLEVMDQRYLCSDLVNLTFSDDRGQSANLEEIGEYSALVLTEQPVPRGAKLNINCGSHALDGIAGACSFDKILGYFVEIRLDAESRWSPQWFAPEHLLALARTPAKALPLAMASGY
jgi:hypothetical protein